jgi:hypothetical protein
MPAIPATHYVKSDDIHVAYQVLGEGPLDLLLVPGFVIANSYRKLMALVVCIKELLSAPSIL